MSDVLCIYYSRTGHTKKAMEEVAAALGAELFITGEMKHNERIEAQGLGMSVLLLGHGESESPVLEPLAQRLREKLSVPVRIYDERNL